MRRAVFSIFFFLPGALLLLSCQTNLSLFPEEVEGFKCDSDVLCGEGLYCVNGICKKIDGKDARNVKEDIWCAKKEECPLPNEQECVSGICRFPCETTSCPTGFYCGVENFCIPETIEDDDAGEDDIGDDDVGAQECADKDDCKFANAFADCREGICVITRCVPGFRDQNRIKSDGCEYQCGAEDKAQKEICDSIDNDCDGIADNVSPKPAEVEHCGMCFRACVDAPNATAKCESYECVLECHPGFEDRDGLYETGCEEGSCTETNGGTEICDGKDNDCNGTIDDGKLCPGEQVCIGGVCRDKCKDKCYPPNSKGCEDDSVVTCQATEEGCLDFVVTEQCGAGTMCDGGKCVEGCRNECVAINEKGCKGDNVVTCGDRDGDLCLEWGDATACGSGKVCEEGVCVERCQNECSTLGDKKCDGDAVIVCGDWNSDICLEWSAPDSCLADEYCEAGECKKKVICSDDCPSVGTTRCMGDTVEKCGNYDSDECLEWAQVEDCKATKRLCNSVKGACFSGCADGYSEGYSATGKMFACQGAWQAPGLNQDSAQCGRKAGDDSPQNPTGVGCTIQDLCAQGFHVCKDRHEVNFYGGCAGLLELESGFWAVRQKSASYGTGNYTINCEPEPTQPNNFFGCGDGGRTPGDNSCYPLTRVAHNNCAEDMEAQSWACPDSSQEYNVVTHGQGPGGVVCCID
ncbi:MAG: hypothetical protein Kow0090_03950 [Myxococcota bacterium]